MSFSIQKSRQSKEKTIIVEFGTTKVAEINEAEKTVKLTTNLTSLKRSKLESFCTKKVYKIV